MLCTGCVGLAIRAIRTWSDQERRPARLSSRATTSCEDLVAPIRDGYGADGPFKMEHVTAGNPGGTPPTVFLPTGAELPRPVVFLLHGYGPNYWPAYQELIVHLVSRGFIVVFGTYPTQGGGSVENRYEALWNSFLAAVHAYRGRMDLTRVGFVGHSFGGGATPALVRKGLIGQGWGKKGAFAFILAPWYAYDVSNADLSQYPPGLLQVLETYDKDTINDHRMAIDLYQRSRVAGGQYFFLARSVTIQGCELTADHRTPAINPSLRLKQYAVFRPLDALIEASFEGSHTAREALVAMGRPAIATGYQPLLLLSTPAPDAPESHYTFKWNAWLNPRRAQEPW